MSACAVICWTLSVSAVRPCHEMDSGGSGQGAEAGPAGSRCSTVYWWVRSILVCPRSRCGAGCMAASGNLSRKLICLGSFEHSKRSQAEAVRWRAWWLCSSVACADMRAVAKGGCQSLPFHILPIRHPPMDSHWYCTSCFVDVSRRRSPCCVGMQRFEIKERTLARA